MRNKPARLFTLIELLIVLAVIAILITLIQPVFVKVINQAKKIVCLNQKRQASIGIFSYTDDNKDHLPNLITRHPWRATVTPLLELGTYMGGPEMIECPSFLVTAWHIQHKGPNDSVDIGSVYLPYRNHKSNGKFENRGLSDSDDVSIYGEQWYSAETLSEDPSYTLLACRASEALAGSSTYTRLTHTPDEESRYTRYPSGTSPAMVGWLGSSAVYLDGSANWVTLEEQSWHKTIGNLPHRFYFPSKRN